MNRRRALLIMGVTAVCAGFAATLSHATAPGTNGRIAFMRYRLHDACSSTYTAMHSRATATPTRQP